MFLTTPTPALILIAPAPAPVPPPAFITSPKARTLVATASNNALR